MAGEWRLLRVEEFANVIGGGTPSTKDETNFNGEIPWITPKDLSGYPYRYISHGDRNITHKGMADSNARLLPPGSILLTTRAPVGYLAIAANPLTTNQGFHSLVLRDGFSSEFIYYLLKANTDYLKANASGTTFGELSGQVLKRLTFRIPSLPKQRAIAHILGALDDKIELNRRMNRTLEAIAQAVFRSWFVENEDGISWKVEKLGDVVINFDSKRIPLSSRERAQRRGKYPYYGAASVMDFIDDYLFDGIYVLIAEDGSVIGEDNHPVIQYVWGKFWVNNHAHVLQGADGISNEYLYLFLKGVNILPYITGAVQPKLNQANMNLIPFPMPPMELCKEFEDFISPLFAQIRANEEQSRTLVSLRDTLLPKLMRGEVRAK